MMLMLLKTLFVSGWTGRKHEWHYSDSSAKCLCDSRPELCSFYLETDHQVFIWSRLGSFPMPSPVSHPSILLPYFLFAADLVGSSQNIAHIPIKPLYTTKFKAIIHNMPEIAVQALSDLEAVVQ